jgi:hypothetical protein
MKIGNSNNAHTLRSKRMRRKYTHDRGATSPERAAGIAAGSDAGDAAYVGETGGAACDADVHADTDAWTVPPAVGRSTYPVQAELSAPVLPGLWLAIGLRLPYSVVNEAQAGRVDGDRE